MASLIGMQIRPFPLIAIKLTFSVVANSAAHTKSPSFSRFSSSVTSIILPSLKSSKASSILLNLNITISFSYLKPSFFKHTNGNTRFWMIIIYFILQKLFYIFPSHIIFQINLTANPFCKQYGGFYSMRDNGNAKLVALQLSNSQTNPINCNRSFFNNEGHDFFRSFNSKPYCIILLGDVDNITSPVYVTGNHMPAEPSIGCHGPFQIDKSSRFNTFQ